MPYTLNQDLEQLVKSRMASGKYDSTESVLRAALRSLEQDENRGQFEKGEWDALLAVGEASGEPIDADKVFDELRGLRTKRPDQTK